MPHFFLFNVEKKSNGSNPSQAKSSTAKYKQLRECNFRYIKYVILADKFFAHMRTNFLKTIVLSVITLICSTPSYSYYYNDSTAMEVDPLIGQLDSMSGSLFTRDKFFVNDDELLQSIYMPSELIPRYSDAEIQEKLKLMPNEVPMIFNNQVKQFIDLFAYKRRALMARCLANSQVYFPVFEQILDQKGLPIELKYLPVVESAFNPIAVSSAGATGLWQLMYGTGTLMGLDVNSYVDERRDPVKSTQAAVNYLKKLYNMYGDWHLVLAAYNSGPGNVNKAIARAGGVKDFWKIMRFLPAETRSYVPLYIAAVYVMNYHKDFNLYSAEPRMDLYSIDTVLITSKVSLSHISSVLGISEDELQFLNPSIKKGIVPYTKNGFPLNLPINYFALFEAKKGEVMTDSSSEVINAAPLVSVPAVIHHKVRPNETLGGIAAKYHVSVASLKSWNHLHSTVIRIGQNLKVTTTKPESTTAPGYAAVFAPRSFEKVRPDTIWNGPSIEDPSVKQDVATDSIAADDSVTGEIQKGASEEKVDDRCGCIYHVVQAGDTLWNIAQKYDGITVEKLKADNREINARPIKVGDILKIFL